MHDGSDSGEELKRWLGRSVHALRDGDVDREAVVRRLQELTEGEPSRRDLGAFDSLDEALNSLAAELLHEDTDLADILDRVRRDANPNGGFGFLHLDAQTLADTDELTPRYLLRKQLGKGGMGEVVTAFDVRIRREVALKRVLPGRATEDALARFLQEAQVTGQLEHPNIVPVYDIGIGPDAKAFFTMKQVKGQPLSEVLRNGTLSRVERLEVFKKVCDALGFAHERGVVHRDLKPGNIMVGDFGQVFVLDWGLARLVGQGAQEEPSAVHSDREGLDVEQTRSDQVMGTVAYMSPEQARGEQASIDARSDVYSLGALLFFLVTGQRAFPKGPDLLTRVRSGDFLPPHAVANVPRELSSIVCRAMSKHPIHRYPTAQALKADLQAWEQGHEVSAHPYSVVERLQRWSSKHGAAVVWSGAVLSAVGTAALAAAGFYLLSMGLALDQALQARRETTLALADSELATAVVLTEQGRFDEAVKQFQSSSKRFESLDMDSERARLTRAWLAPRITEPAWRRTGNFVDVANGPNGELAIAHIEGVDEASNVDPLGATLMVVGVRDGEVRSERRFTKGAMIGYGFVGDEPVVVTAEGGRLEVSRFDGTVVIDLSAMALSENGRVAWVESDRILVSDSTLGTWQYGADGGARRGPFPFRLLPFRDVAGRYRVATRVPQVGSLGPIMDIVDLESGEWVWSGPAGSRVLNEVGDVISHEEGTLRVRGLNGEERWSYPMPGLDSVTVGRNRVVASAGGRRIRILDLDGQLLGTQNMAVGPSSSLGHYSLSVDGLSVLTVADGELAMTWLREGTEGGGFVTRNMAFALDVSADGWLVAVGHRDGTIELRERESGRTLQSIQTGGACYDVVFEGPRLLAACGSAGLLSISMDGAVFGLLGGDQSPTSVAVLGGRVYVVAHGATLGRLDEHGLVDTVDVPGGEVWDLVATSGRVIASSRKHGFPSAFFYTEDLQPVDFGVPDGATYRLAATSTGVVMSSHRGTLRHVDARTGVTSDVAVATKETVMAVAVSPDETRLAVGRYDGSVEIFDLENGTTILTVPTYARSIVDMAWSPSGPVYLNGAGLVETLDAGRLWPTGATFTAPSLQQTHSRPHLVHSAIAADAWEAVASLVRADPSLYDALSPADAVRAAFVAGDVASLDAALVRTNEVSQTTALALRAAMR